MTRPSIHDLAADLGLKRASEIAPPARRPAAGTAIAAPDEGGDVILPATPKPPSEHEAVRARWSKAKRDAFAALAPHSLGIVATEGPVSIEVRREDGSIARYGHNRGVWPARIVSSASWKDTMTPTWNKSPFVWTGLVIRAWVPSYEHQVKLALSVSERMSQIAEAAGPVGHVERGIVAEDIELRNGFTNLGAEIDLAQFEIEIHAIADRLHIPIWDDEGLSLHLDRLVAGGLGRRS